MSKPRHKDYIMKAVETPRTNQKIAESQDEYITLPVERLDTPEGHILITWQLTWRERFKILFCGRLYHWVLTFGMPLQPISLTVGDPSKPTNKDNGSK